MFLFPPDPALLVHEDISESSNGGQFGHENLKFIAASRSYSDCTAELTTGFCLINLALMSPGDLARIQCKCNLVIALPRSWAAKAELGAEKIKMSATFQTGVWRARRRGAQARVGPSWWDYVEPLRILRKSNPIKLDKIFIHKPSHKPMKNVREVTLHTIVYQET